MEREEAARKVNEFIERRPPGVIAYPAAMPVPPRRGPQVQRNETELMFGTTGAVCMV
jgi:hypothetical protein